MRKGCKSQVFTRFFPSLAPTSRLAVAAPGGGDHGDRLAGLHLRLVATAELVDPPVLAPHEGAPPHPHLARLAAIDTEGPDAAVGGEDGAGHRLEEAQGAAGAVARLPASLAARALADVEILQHHGEARFQDFRIGEAGIGHVHMHRIRAVESPAPRASRNRSFRNTDTGRRRM